MDTAIARAPAASVSLTSSRPCMRLLLPAAATAAAAATVAAVAAVTITTTDAAAAVAAAAAPVGVASAATTAAASTRSLVRNSPGAMDKAAERRDGTGATHPSPQPLPQVRSPACGGCSGEPGQDGRDPASRRCQGCEDLVGVLDCRDRVHLPRARAHCNGEWDGLAVVCGGRVMWRWVQQTRAARGSKRTRRKGNWGGAARAAPLRDRGLGWGWAAAHLSQPVLPARECQRRHMDHKERNGGGAPRHPPPQPP